MKTIDQLMKEAFDRPRDARSPAYKLGMRETLALYPAKRDNPAAELRCPFQAGTADFDAFFAGADEGHHVARQEKL